MTENQRGQTGQGNQSALSCPARSDSAAGGGEGEEKRIEWGRLFCVFVRAQWCLLWLVVYFGFGHLALLNVRNG